MSGPWRRRRAPGLSSYVFPVARQASSDTPGPTLPGDTNAWVSLAYIPRSFNKRSDSRVAASPIGKPGFPSKSTESSPGRSSPSKPQCTFRAYDLQPLPLRKQLKSGHSGINDKQAASARRIPESCEEESARLSSRSVRSRHKPLQCVFGLARMRVVQVLPICWVVTVGNSADSPFFPWLNLVWRVVCVRCADPNFSVRL